MAKKDMTPAERKAHRKARREERRRLRAEGKLPPKKPRAGRAPGEAAGVTPGRLGRRERRALKRAAKLAAKQALRPKEPVDRGPVISMIVGKRSQFTDAQMAHHNLDLLRDTWPGVYVLRYEGEGYIDADSASDLESAKRIVGHFRIGNPNMKVTWLKE